MKLSFTRVADTDYVFSFWLLLQGQKISPFQLLSIIKWSKGWILYCYVIDYKKYHSKHCNIYSVHIIILNINVEKYTSPRSTFIRMCHPSRSLLVRCCGQTRMGLAKLCGWPTFPPRRTAGSTGPDGLLSEKPIAQTQACCAPLAWEGALSPSARTCLHRPILLQHMKFCCYYYIHIVTNVCIDKYL